MSNDASTTATASDQGADMTINASIAATETSEGIASLPNELKSIIIGHYVQFLRIITWKSQGSLFRLRLGPFLIEKFFGEAAQRIYYGSNLFHIQQNDTTRCRFPSHAMGHRVRYLKANMDCEIPRPNLSGHLDPEPESIEPPDWMLRFSRLERLTKDRLALSSKEDTLPTSLV